MIGNQVFLKRRIIFCLFIFLFFLTSTFAADSQNHPPKIPLFVFENASVIPMDREYILENHSVVVQDGKIIKICPARALQIPEGGKIINAEGKFLIPALSDMHVHLEGDAWNIMFPPQLRYSSEEINFEYLMFLYLANGIGTIEVMSALPEHINLRDKINKGEILGPRLVLSRMIDGPGKAWPPPISVWVKNSQEAKSAVIEAHEQGYDRMKVYSFLDKKSYDSVITTAKSLKMGIDGHIPYSLSIEYVLGSGQDMIAHSEEVLKFAKDYTDTHIDYLAKIAAKSKIWITPTLITSRNIIAVLKDFQKEFSKPDTRYLHPMSLGIWSFIYQNMYKKMPETDRQKIEAGYKLFQGKFIKKFLDHGGKLLIGTDALIPSTVPGVSIHDELEELVAAGLTPYQALKISTTNVFEFLGELDKSGTISTGKETNLVLLEKNPLENISHTKMISGILIKNTWISKKVIKNKLDRIVDFYKKLKKKKLNKS